MEKDAPQITIECLGIRKGWSPVFNQETYIIDLGKIIEEKHSTLKPITLLHFLNMTF